MSIAVSVMTVHNSVGEFKPILVNHDGQKLKIEKINYEIVNYGVRLYNCQIGGYTRVLSFNEAESKWYLSDD